MERKTWTTRGKMFETDRAVIARLADENQLAARIFITGEVHEDYIGDASRRLLINANDIFYKNDAGQEPMFVETKDDTIRMTRFDPSFVWRCFHPDTLVELITDETKRLGVKLDPYQMEHYDFYEAMIDAFQEENGLYKIPVVKKRDMDSFYNAVYLSCLLLYNKPNYMDIPVAQHFADPAVAEQLRHMEYRELNADQKREAMLTRGRHEEIQALTNPELNFVVSLFEQG